MRITLNLASRPFADIGPILKRLRIGMLVLILVSCGLALGLHALHRKAEEARARVHSLDGSIAQATAQRAEFVSMMKEPDNARLLAETKTLNTLFDEKAFSWTLTIESLETVLPGGVQVSTLQPAREKDGSITLHMRVVGPRDKGIEFVRNLEHSRRFRLPRIVNESAQSTNLPGQGVQPVSDTNRFSFDLLVGYNPPTPEEIEAGKRRGNGHDKASGAHAAGGPAGHGASALAPPHTGIRRPYVRPEPNKPNPDRYATRGGQP